jgi:hypothetical protein
MVSLLFIYNWLLDHLYSTSACCILERKIVFVVCYKTPMNSLKENKPFKNYFVFPFILVYAVLLIWISF